MGKRPLIDKSVKNIKNIKNIYLNYDKYRASFSQSKQTGLLSFDVSVSAPTLVELENESRDAITRCVTVCNEFNSGDQNQVKKKADEKEQKKKDDEKEKGSKKDSKKKKDEPT